MLTPASLGLSCHPNFLNCVEVKCFINPQDFSSSHLHKCLISHHVTRSYPFYRKANKNTKPNRHLSEMTVMHPLRVYSKSYSRNTSFIRTCFECSSGDLFIIFKFPSFSVNTSSQSVMSGYLLPKSQNGVHLCCREIRPCMHRCFC